MEKERHVIEEKGYIPKRVLDKVKLKRQIREKILAVEESPRESIAIQVISGEIPDEAGLEAEEYFFAGWQLEYGISSFKDTELAIKAYEIAVSKGYIKAITALGDLFKKNGNLEEAYRWYLEGSLLEKPIEHSLYGLALMYHEGEYVTQDYAKALKYFKMSYFEGCQKTLFYLGQYYENGFGTEHDYKKANDYYRLGANVYDEDCKRALIRMEKDLENTDE